MTHMHDFKSSPVTSILAPVPPVTQQHFESNSIRLDQIAISQDLIDSTKNKILQANQIILATPCEAVFTNNALLLRTAAKHMAWFGVSVSVGLAIAIYVNKESFVESMATPLGRMLYKVGSSPVFLLNFARQAHEAFMDYRNAVARNEMTKSKKNQLNQLAQQLMEMTHLVNQRILEENSIVVLQPGFDKAASIEAASSHLQIARKE